MLSLGDTPTAPSPAPRRPPGRRRRRSRAPGSARGDAGRREMGRRAVHLRPLPGLGEPQHRPRARLHPRRARRDVPAHRGGARQQRTDQNMAQATIVVLGLIGILFIIIEGAALVDGLGARALDHAAASTRSSPAPSGCGSATSATASRSEPRSARRAGRVVQRDDREHRGPAQQQAEKRRLEEELRIAREIQMSLLPRGRSLIAGLSLAALCLPAREVGGDYYDFFPLGDGPHRRAGRRRVGQGDFGRALHGGAEGAGAVAQRIYDRRRGCCRGEPDHRRQPRHPQLHHHDLRGGRRDEARR